MDKIASCIFMFFLVCDAPYPIVSVARLLLQGFRVALDGVLFRRGTKDRPIPVEDVASRPTARRLTGKQSTIARPPTQEASVPAKKPHLKAQPSAVFPVSEGAHDGRIGRSEGDCGTAIGHE